MGALRIAVTLMAVIYAADACRCDQKLIDQILKDNEGKYPQHFLTNWCIEAKKTAIVRSSEGVIPKNVACTLTEYREDCDCDGVDFVYTNFLKNGTKENGEFFCQEKLGYFVNRWTGGKGDAIRVVIYADKYMILYYKCERCGKSCEKPEGYVSVSLKHGIAESQPSIEKAIKKAEEYGIDLTRTLKTDCHK